MPPLFRFKLLQCICGSPLHIFVDNPIITLTRHSSVRLSCDNYLQYAGKIQEVITLSDQIVII